MNAVAVSLLACVAALPSIGASPPVMRSRRRLVRAVRRVWVVPVVQLGLLAGAGLLVVVAEPASPVLLAAFRVLSVLAAAGGAGPLVRAAFRTARRVAPAPPPPQELLHGGAVIGVLERTGIAVTLLAGWPEGLAVVLAVKGLARYPELREARAGELFIIGTFTSVLWAVACWSVAAAAT